MYVYIYLTENMSNVWMGLKSSKNDGSSNPVLENMLFLDFS